jgi:hypothetical protein
MLMHFTNYSVTALQGILGAPHCALAFQSKYPIKKYRFREAPLISFYFYESDDKEITLGRSAYRKKYYYLQALSAHRVPVISRSNITIYLIFALRPSSGIVEAREHNPSSGEGADTYSVEVSSF